VGHRVRKGKNPEIGFDDALLPFDVPREARVAEGLQVSRPNPLSHLEARLDRQVDSCRMAGRQSAGYHVACQYNRHASAPFICASLALRSAVDTMPLLLEKVFERMHPMLVIARGEILGGRNPLLGVAPLVDVHVADATYRKEHRKDPPLPFGVKRRLLGRMQNSAEAVHPAKIVDTVHQSLQGYPVCLGAFGNPVPVIESRVMSSINCASVHPSVPGGRSGSTI